MPEKYTPQQANLSLEKKIKAQRERIAKINKPAKYTAIFNNKLNDFLKSQKKKSIPSKLRMNALTELYIFLKRIIRPSQLAKMSRGLDKRLSILKKGLDIKIVTNRHYIVQKGDNIGKIIQRKLKIYHTKTPALYFALYKAINDNRGQNANPAIIYIGEVLDLSSAKKLIKSKKEQSPKSILWYMKASKKTSSPKLKKLYEALIKKETPSSPKKAPKPIKKKAIIRALPVAAPSTPSPKPKVVQSKPPPKKAPTPTPAVPRKSLRIFTKPLSGLSSATIRNQVKGFNAIISRMNPEYHSRYKRAQTRNKKNLIMPPPLTYRPKTAQIIRYKKYLHLRELYLREGPSKLKVGQYLHDHSNGLSFAKITKIDKTNGKISLEWFRKPKVFAKGRTNLQDARNNWTPVKWKEYYKKTLPALVNPSSNNLKTSISLSDLWNNKQKLGKGEKRQKLPSRISFVSITKNKGRLQVKKAQKTTAHQEFAKFAKKLATLHKRLILNAKLRNPDKELKHQVHAYLGLLKKSFKMLNGSFNNWKRSINESNFASISKTFIGYAKGSISAKDQYHFAYKDWQNKIKDAKYKYQAFNNFVLKDVKKKPITPAIVLKLQKKFPNDLFVQQLALKHQLGKNPSAEKLIKMRGTLMNANLHKKDYFAALKHYYEASKLITTKKVNGESFYQNKNGTSSITLRVMTLLRHSKKQRFLIGLSSSKELQAIIPQYQALRQKASKALSASLPTIVQVKTEVLRLQKIENLSNMKATVSQMTKLREIKSQVIKGMNSGKFGKFMASLGKGILEILDDPNTYVMVLAGMASGGVGAGIAGGLSKAAQAGRIALSFQKLSPFVLQMLISGATFHALNNVGQYAISGGQLGRDWTPESFAKSIAMMSTFGVSGAASSKIAGRLGKGLFAKAGGVAIASSGSLGTLTMIEATGNYAQTGKADWGKAFMHALQFEIAMKLAHSRGRSIGEKFHINKAKKIERRVSSLVEQRQKLSSQYKKATPKSTEAIALKKQIDKTDSQMRSEAVKFQRNQVWLKRMEIRALHERLKKNEITEEEYKLEKKRLEAELGLDIQRSNEMEGNYLKPTRRQSLRKKLRNTGESIGQRISARIKKIKESVKESPRLRNISDRMLTIAGKSPADLLTFIRSKKGQQEIQIINISLKEASRNINPMPKDKKANQLKDLLNRLKTIWGRVKKSASISIQKSLQESKKTNREDLARLQRSYQNLNSGISNLRSKIPSLSAVWQATVKSLKTDLTPKKTAKKIEQKIKKAEQEIQLIPEAQKNKAKKLLAILKDIWKRISKKTKTLVEKAKEKRPKINLSNLQKGITEWITLKPLLDKLAGIKTPQQLITFKELFSKKTPVAFGELWNSLKDLTIAVKNNRNITATLEKVKSIKNTTQEAISNLPKKSRDHIQKTWNRIKESTNNIIKKIETWNKQRKEKNRINAEEKAKEEIQKAEEADRQKLKDQLKKIGEELPIFNEKDGHKLTKQEQLTEGKALIQKLLRRVQGELKEVNIDLPVNAKTPIEQIIEGNKLLKKSIATLKSELGQIGMSIPKEAKTIVEKIQSAKEIINKEYTRIQNELTKINESFTPSDRKKSKVEQINKARSIFANRLNIIKKQFQKWGYPDIPKIAKFTEAERILWGEYFINDTKTNLKALKRECQKLKINMDNYIKKEKGTIKERMSAIKLLIERMKAQNEKKGQQKIEYDKELHEVDTSQLKEGDFIYIKTQSGSIYQFAVEIRLDGKPYVRYTSGPDTLFGSSGTINSKQIKVGEIFSFGTASTSEIAQLEIRRSSTKGRNEWYTKSNQQSYENKHKKPLHPEYESLSTIIEKNKKFFSKNKLQSADFFIKNDTQETIRFISKVIEILKDKNNPNRLTIVSNILGLSGLNNARDITSAKKQLSKQYHPDKFEQYNVEIIKAIGEVQKLINIAGDIATKQ